MLGFEFYRRDPIHDAAHHELCIRCDVVGVDRQGDETREITWWCVDGCKVDPRKKKLWTVEMAREFWAVEEAENDDDYDEDNGD